MSAPRRPTLLTPGTRATLDGVPHRVLDVLDCEAGPVVLLDGGRWVPMETWLRQAREVRDGG